MSPLFAKIEMPALSSLTDTIAAITTPFGQGGVGIIRVSGTAAYALLEKFFKPSREIKTYQTHHLYHGWFLSGEQPIDEILAVYMTGPRSFTGESTVEFHCHGSPVLLGQALNALLAERCVRLAEPGEFTKRAYLNGRIDLTQAEAIADLISAESDQALHFASHQLRGELTARLKDIKELLIPFKAHCEAIIDFASQEIEDLDIASASQLLSRALSKTKCLMESHSSWKLYNSSHTIAIVGLPNVGKSSLLNRLLGTERAIVSRLPGTTRDTIEEKVLWKGIPLRLIDTAGLREADGEVEREGVSRAHQKIDEADLILWVIDGSRPLSKEELHFTEKIDPKRLLVTFNKADLPRCTDRAAMRALEKYRTHETSCLTGDGIGPLKERLVECVTGKTSTDGNAHFAINARHMRLLERLHSTLETLVETTNTKPLALDLLVVDLQESLDILGELLGENISDEVLDAIFSLFCLGK